MVLGGAIAGAIGAAASGLAGGLVDTGQSPAKLEIIPQSPSKLQPITVPFNPNSYSITKSVNWTPTQTANGQDGETERLLNAPRLQPGGGDSRILTLELFFDVTENPNIPDVRTQTNEIVKLTQIERDTGQQPICALRWGKPIGSEDFPFIGVVTNLVQNFTLFRRNGQPVRARLTVTFREYLDAEQDQRQTDPELTTRIVKRGDTLSSIAAEVYGNPTLWRAIAEANHLDDPRHLEPGKTLSIPELR